MRSCALTALALLLSGCDPALKVVDAGPLPDVDTTMCPAAGCAPPFECLPRSTATGVVMTCTTRALPEPSCTPPDGLEVNLLESDLEDVPAHWIVGGCVPVTVDDVIATRIEAVDAAITDFNATECSALCFEAAARSNSPLDIHRRERRLHFRAVSDEEAGAAYIQPTAYYERSTSRIFSAEVIVAASRLHELGVGDLSAALMLSIGFAATPSDRTVTQSPLPPGLRDDALLPPDRDAVCALYEAPRCSAALTAP